MNIGDKVVIDPGLSTMATGIYIGNASVIKDKSMLTLYVVNLDDGCRGYLHSNINNKPTGYISSILVHPDNLKLLNNNSEVS